MPVPRALHTLTSLGQRFVLLGGKGPLGELGDVSLLECPAVQQGLQLQHQQQGSQAQLLRCQQRGAQVAADLACSRAELQEAKRQLQVMIRKAVGMYACAPPLAYAACMLEVASLSRHVYDQPKHTAFVECASLGTLPPCRQPLIKYASSLLKPQPPASTAALWRVSCKRPRQQQLQARRHHSRQLSSSRPCSGGWREPGRAGTRQ
jgi:hypothetical protein